MVKKKSHIHPKKKLHPVIIAILSLFAVVTVALVITAQAYRNVSPLEEVAGAATSSAEKAISPSVTPTQKTCVAVGAILGDAPCQKDVYKSVHVVCGDGTKPTLSSDASCQSLSVWMAKIATACTGHSSCQASPSATRPPLPTISPRPTGRPTGVPPHATFQQ